MTKSPKYYFFLGIGGIGMSALARYFHAKGFVVGGYDRNSSELSRQLEKEGIEIIYEDESEKIEEQFKDKEECQIVYTPAIPKSSKLLSYFKDAGFQIAKRSEILGEISKKHKTIAVAGTHGKTTISILIAYLLKQSGFKINALLGGISHNFGSNVILEEDAEILVTEADEYDQSFLRLNPDLAVISSVDADHLDIYGEEKEMLNSYNSFAKQISVEGILISKPQVLEKLEFSTKSYSYGINTNTDYAAMNVLVENGQYHFDLQAKKEEIKDLQCGLPGIHNVENSVAAIAVAREMGAKNDSIKEALRTFKGVKRRFDVHIKNERIVYIDDYAHHPKEIDALLQSVKELYPNKKISGIFQPHLFSRTRDFADDFAESLALLDELILLDIYPAREEPIEGINSKWLLEKVPLENKKSCSLDEAVSLIRKSKIEVLLTIGAGSIDTLVEAIKKELEKW